MNLNELKDRAYKIACEHGWHDNEYSDEHWLMLILTELSEAVNADRKRKYANIGMFKSNCNTPQVRPEKHWKYIYELFIKDSVQDELADVVIRLLDLAGMRKIDLEDFDYEGSDTEDYDDMSFTESMFRISVYLTDGFYKRELPIILNEIFAFCKERGIDIAWYIEQKMKYNELRDYKHGGKQY